MVGSSKFPLWVREGNDSSNTVLGGRSKRTYSYLLAGYRGERGHVGRFEKKYLLLWHLVVAIGIT